MSRWLLVELEPDLAKHYTTRTGVWCGIKGINGVKSLTDISAISRRTADALVGDVFLPDDQSLLPKSRKARA
jgi:hypothetical protein